MQAMILAAGFGTRLLPYTQTLPKPLFPVLNKPLLLATIERLQRLGFQKIIVNCHHLQEQIVAKIDNTPGVLVQREEEILGTGGGLRRALSLMDDTPLLITNGDIYHMVDMLDLYRYHVTHSFQVTMAMHDFSRFNSVQVADDRVIAFGRKGEKNTLAFTGIHVIDPEILSMVEDGVKSCIIDLYRRLLQAGKPINCYRVDGNFWTDMGTPDDYLSLHGLLLQGLVPTWSELTGGVSGENPYTSPYFVHKDTKIPDTVELADWAAVGNATIGESSSLRRVVVWDGAVVEKDVRLQDTIVV